MSGGALNLWLNSLTPLMSLRCSGGGDSRRQTGRVIVSTWLIPAVVASPYLYSGTFHFRIHSNLGTVSRLVCTDRFDELDSDGDGGNQFRRAFFLFLFVFVYCLPLTLIGGTCIRTAAALRRKTDAALAPLASAYSTAIVVQKREQNRRKVQTFLSRILNLHC